MRPAFILVATGAFFLGGCNSYSLRYAARPQPSGAPLYADYTRLDDSVAVEVDTHRRPLEEAYIRKADGTIVHAQSIADPQGGTPPPLSTSIGAGFGFQHDATNNVSYGTGLAVPTPDRPEALTRAVFSTAAIGPAPWELHVKLQGEPEAVIPGVGGPPTAR